MYFYPRPPGGGRHFNTNVLPEVELFLSTPSGWRATAFTGEKREAAAFLSTPSGWRATSTVFCALLDMPISIHALRVEGDTPHIQARVRVSISIHALRVEGDLKAAIVVDNRLISIHALRVEGDVCNINLCAYHVDFYPRPPGGGRPAFYRDTRTQPYFYPRPPGGGRQPV